MNCFFCEGVAHPSTGCQYSANVVACCDRVVKFQGMSTPKDIGLTPAEAKAEQAQPYHPDPVINAEVIADRDEGRTVDAMAGIREGWHRGWPHRVHADFYAAAGRK